MKLNNTEEENIKKGSASLRGDRLNKKNVSKDEGLSPRVGVPMFACKRGCSCERGKGVTFC